MLSYSEINAHHLKDKSKLTDELIKKPNAGKEIREIAKMAYINKS